MGPLGPHGPMYAASLRGGLWGPCGPPLRCGNARSAVYACLSEANIALRPVSHRYPRGKIDGM